MSNETNETPVQGRKVGIARFFELLGRDLWPLYKSGILCVLGFLPGTALAVFGMMAGSALLTVVGGVVGGLVGGPFLSGMIDTVLRALRDEPGYWWNTYKRAWKQNWRQSLVPGALLGCVPQCGFSAVAANFYASRVITPGTLLAVFLTTSDEAIPLLAAEPTLWNKLGLLLVLKIVFGIAAGLVLDVPLRRILPKGLYGGYEGHADEVDCHEEHEEHSSIFLAALRHTLEIFVFILVFSFIIGLIFGFVGADSAAAFLGSLGIFQPMMAALIGLVPNCGASVLLAQLYMGGAITFGSFFAGLCSGAGIGLAVLWRVNPSWKQNLFMTGLLWFCGTCCGILLQWVV